MSQDSQGSFFTATVMAGATFLLAFGCLWTLGDFALFPSAFFAGVIAAIVWLILYIGIGSPNRASESVKTTSAPAPAEAAAPVAAMPAAAAPVREPSAEAAEAKRQADEQAAERAAAEEARRKVEQEEIAEAKRKAETDAAEAKRKAEADATEAKRKADAEAAEAKRKSDEAAAAEAKTAAEEAKPAMTDNASAASTPDYDGDGVREGTDEGTRPTGLDGPRDGKADDLKQIKGIGAKMEELCNRLGFWHFDQIAAWSAEEVAWVDANLEGFKGRVTRDTWVEQARVLAGGGETEFSKRVEDGDVY